MTWWDNAVGYEVYIRSFADSDGDGIGDLDGLTARLDHLAWLGADLLWVTPFYPSPLKDFGYDVADYLDVHPNYGDLEAFDRCLARCHELGIRMLIDLVPNHTSDQHPWFLDAIAGRHSAHRDYYIFRPPRSDGGPPNNWVSHFGGPAWTLDPNSGEYYCHLFLPEQPDLNWANPAVQAEFESIIASWLGRGVDGFRIDVAHGLCKDPALADNPQIAEITPDMSPREVFAAFEHVYDLERPETGDIYRQWRRIADHHDALLLGEVNVGDVSVSRQYLGEDGLHRALYFGLNDRPWDAEAFASDLRRAAEIAPDGGFSWAISNHDEPRPVTRFGGGGVGLDRSLAIWVAFAGLPGTPFLYQGEELGLEDCVIERDDVHDPVGLASYEEGRDPCRTPMPWEPGEQLGFTTASRAWLASPTRDATETVAAQRDQPGSPLHRFRDLLTARREMSPLRRGPLEWITDEPGVVAFRRGEVVHLSNLGDHPVAIDLPPGEWGIRYDSGSGLKSEGKKTEIPAALAPRSGMILRRSGST